MYGNLVADKLKSDLLPNIKSILGETIQFDVQVVGAIEKTQAGKYRYVVNNLEGR